MRSVLTLAISVAMALGAIGLAVAAPGGLVGDPELARAEIQAASGAVSIANSRAGEAVFNATAMRPGEGISGTVTIGNDGDRPGRFAVQASGLQDMAGPGGGKLSERVELVLYDVTNANHPATVYAGPPADFGVVDLGVIPPGGERDYLVAATFPEGGADDNRFQGAALALGFDWHAAPVGGSGATPTATPAPNAPEGSAPKAPDTPAPKAPDTPAPKAPDTPAPNTPAPKAPTTSLPVAIADALGMPAPNSCVKGGRLRVRLAAPAEAKVVSATLKVNGRVKARLKGAKAGRTVSLKGLTKKTKLAISIRASDGRTYSAARTYSACKR